MREEVLDISWKTILKVFIAIFIFYIIYQTKEIVLWFLFALIISILLEPAINFLRWLRFPKILAIVLVYFSIFGFLGILIYLISPIFIFELKQFSQQIPEYFIKINPLLKQWGIEAAYSFNDLTKILIGRLEEGSKGVISAVAAFFGGIASTIFILSLAFFLSLEEKRLERMIILIAPKRYEEKAINVFERVQRKVASWFGARILACLFVGVACFIIFFIFGIKYSFLLALLAGILNFIPYIGPWITGIFLALLITATDSLILTIYSLFGFVIIQAIEGNFLTPLLMKKMINLPPVLVLISLLVGSRVFGFLGLVFSVPVFGIIYEFIKEFFEKRKEQELQGY